ncbi:MAG: N-ethylammeline chlorohydrolase [Bacillaceae bacterium G1]|nr:N-ethylammeline chlorohydrolase [Bacillota bacterium]OJF17372.1 MAG: N-ethylammeline chlorohydrolase [Bacillaceae bacterium G1]
MKTMKRLFYGATIITGTGTTIADGWLVVEDGIIRYVGPPKVDEPGTFDAMTNLRGKILLPGLVNTHTHAAMSLLRGYADDLPLQQWLEEKMWPMEAQFTDREVYWGSALSVVEMIKSGTTCFADMYDHMDQVARVVEEAGVRACLARGVIGLGEPAVVQGKIAEMTQFAKAYHGAANGRITTMVSPHALYTCPPEVLEQIIAISEELDLPIHTHLSETKKEVEDCWATYGKPPVLVLEEIGLFRRPTHVAHAVHLTEAELDLLAQRGVSVSHNPGSNLKLASGIAPVPAMLRRGMTVSLGTDGAASNNNLDMFEEMRLASLIHKGNTLDPLAVSAEQALAMATVEGAKSLGLDAVIGTLEAGKEADFIVVQPTQPHWQPLYDPVSHLVYSARAEDVLDVYVQGKPIMLNRQLTTLDEERIVYEVRQITNAWK